MNTMYKDRHMNQLQRVMTEAHTQLINMTRRLFWMQSISLMTTMSELRHMKQFKRAHQID
jgi:hypothetical protein